jgi:Co/Zn/Cd efflux system component
VDPPSNNKISESDVAVPRSRYNGGRCMRFGKVLKKFRPKSLHLRHQLAEHWKDSDEMHEVMHSFPGYFRALLLELLDQPMSHEDLQEVLRQFGVRMAAHHKRDMDNINLDRDITAAIECDVLEEKNGKYALTPAGREMTEHIQAAIPFFFDRVLSVKMVSIVTISVHVLLSILKLAFGFISKSAGLIADGIDNTADTLSSVLVWLGIKFDKEKLVSLFIVVMMFVSVGGVAIASINKIVHPEPIQEGLFAFVVSLGCGLLMSLLSAYQYLVGKRQSNFEILCQAVDSRNHFFTSLLVCGGSILSFLAQQFQADWSTWFYYADALASIIIGLLILQNAVELMKELVKPDDEPAEVSHFVRSMQEKVRKKIVFDWLSQQLKDEPLTREQLEERFTQQFCEQTPKILKLSGMGYCPESSEDVHQHLDHFVKGKKLVLREGKYTLF